MDLLDYYSSDESIESGPSERIKNNAAPCKPGRVTTISSEEMPPGTFDRTVPHIRGCWAGHIFLSISDDDPEGEWKTHAVEATKRFSIALEEVGWSGTVVTHSELHLSLSQPFFLQIASIESFHKELRLALSHVRGLVLQVDEEVILSNDDGTRSFFAWKLADNPSLHHIVSQVDSVMLKYKQPTYYSPPIFHVSFASVRGKPPDCRRHLGGQGAHRNHDSLAFYARKVSCSFGTVNRIELMLPS